MLVLRRLELPPDLDSSMAAVFMCFFGLGYALSVQLRCIILIILPTFCGKAGRGYVMTFAVAYLLAGPVKNIVLNAQEASRAVACSAELSSNLTKERMNLRLSPLKNIMADLQVRKPSKQTTSEVLQCDGFIAASSYNTRNNFKGERFLPTSQSSG